MEEKISLMPTIAIHTASPFKDLFPIKESVLNEIAEDMKQNGFDFAHPIIIWAGHKVTVVDGHIKGVRFGRRGASICNQSSEPSEKSDTTRASELPCGAGQEKIRRSTGKISHERG